MDSRQFRKDERFQDLKALQKEYAEFRPFLFDVIEGLMGFQCTWVQFDIAAYLEHGPLYRMIQAQRGQAKTTVTAAYAVWRIIQDPTTRVLILSSGSDMAQEISNWIIQIIAGMPELECLVPDRSAGDRASVKAYDIHHELRGPEKSPSVACMGITSNMQGKRADVLIADDIESAKNSATEVQRSRLVHLTRDFTSICSTGDIIYLGTPQSVDSVYNGLVSRGFKIRIWPGRYPTEKEQANYGENLAPAIAERMAADSSLRSGGGPIGDRGKAVDDVLLPEDVLIKKEIDQGAAYFQLQHMLDTHLSDAERFPLKASKCIFMQVNAKRAPIEINFQAAPQSMIYPPVGWPTQDSYYRASSFGEEFSDFIGCHMYVDPAGGGMNGDETAYAVTKFSGNKVFVVDFGGVPGGLDSPQLDELTKIAVKWKPDVIGIEKNFGNGALSSVWQPVLLREHKARIDDVWESGQKELRIIDVLEPIIGSGRLVFDEGLLAHDWETCAQYPIEKRSTYSLWYQLSRITRTRGSLIHDDRLDALAGSVRHWINNLAQDDKRLATQAAQKRYNELMKDPLGDGSGLGHNVTTPNALSRMRMRW